jgi:S1-C subfamily serine protease
MRRFVPAKGTKSPELYRKVAQATVRIATPVAGGSGVLLQTAVPGLVLTNWHVARTAAYEGLKLKVQVQVPKIDADGAAVPDRIFDAYVLKWSEEYDLAIVRIVDPPADLPSVPLPPAGYRPQPGEPVFALGSNAAGLLWAIKPGMIEQVGDSSMFTRAYVEREKCSALAKAAQPTPEACAETIAGGAKLIQTSCAIFSGDSGGPLVSSTGELVGLNVAIPSKGPSMAFHVHLDSIRTFLDDKEHPIPATPPIVLGEPWPEAESFESGAIDTDLDGRPDLVAFKEERRVGRLFMLGKGTEFKAGSPDVRALLKARKFRAPLSVIDEEDRGTFVWYDTEGKGTADLVVVAPTDGDQVTLVRFEQGSPRIVGADPRRETVSPKYFRDPELAARLRSLASSEDAAAQSPDPLWGGGPVPSLLDLDEDEQADTIATEGFGAHGFLVDPQQETIANIPPGELAKRLQGRTVGARFSLIVGKKDTWVFYGLDDAGRNGVAIRAIGGVATGAWKLVDGKLGGELPGERGRIAVRPGLVPADQRAGFVAKLSTQLPMPDEGIGSFPGLPTFTEAVVSAQGKTTWSALTETEGTLALVARFDGAGLPPAVKATEKTVGAALASGKFRPQFAWMGRAGMEWAFYDTDLDGRYDVVLFSSDPESGRADGAWRLGKDGVARADAALAAGSLFRPSLFGKRATPAAKGFFEATFRERAVER